VLLVVARIGRPHGVHGEVSIEVRTDSPEVRFQMGRILQTDPVDFGPLTIESIRDHNGVLLLKFKEITDRTSVENLKDVILLAEVDIDEGNSKNEFHFQQLINCIAYLPNGTAVGPVIDIVHIPGQDLLVIDYGGREIMIPFVAEIVPDVDLKNKKIIISDKEGLLDG
jgi:16S rRNA processing protein RimM